jgi:hypothetical protein
LHVVRGGGHLFLLDDRDDVIETIDDFLSSEVALDDESELPKRARVRGS